jgi:lysophospholipase L1-like esterase
MKHKAPQEPKPLKAFRDKYLAAFMMVAALFITFTASAQLDSAKYSQINGYGFKYKRMAFDSVLMVPRSTSPHVPYRPGGLKYNPADSTHLLVWTGSQWLQVGDNGSGIDTAYYDQPYLTVVSGLDTFNIDLSALGSVDSVSVYKHDGADSVFTKVNTVEAFSFIDNNNFPTSHTFNTATGILETQRHGLTSLFVDLDGRYVETLARRNDSVFVYRNGLETFVFKDSTGIPGVSTLNNVGSGLRLVTTPNGSIKTLVFGYGLNGDSTTNANSITVQADTSELVTPSDLADAIAGAGGATTVTQRRDTLLYNDGAEHVVSVGEKFIGQIYNKDTWANLNDFIEVGTSNWVLSGDSIQGSGGIGNFSHALNLNVGNHDTTNLQKWKMSANFRALSTPGATTYGFGLGIRSTNNDQRYNAVGHFDASNTATGGKLMIYSGVDSVVLATSTTGISFSAGDEINLTVEQYDNNLIVAARNITTNSATITARYIYEFQTGAVMHNTGQFAVFSFGGNFSFDSLAVESAEIKNANVLVMTDSKGAGYSAGSFGESWASLLAGRYKTVVNVAGGSDATTELITRIPELLALNPKQVLLQIPSNDIRYSVSEATSHESYERIVKALHDAGIPVYHLTPIYETSVDLSGQYTYLYNTFSADSIIDVWTPTNIAGTLYTDNIHPNTFGHQKVFEKIVSSNKLYGALVPIQAAGATGYLPKFVGPTGLGISHISDDNTYVNSSLPLNLTSTGTPAIWFSKTNGTTNQKDWKIETDANSFSIKLYADSRTEPGATGFLLNRSTTSFNYARLNTSLGIQTIPGTGYVLDAVGKARITATEGNQALTLRLNTDHQLEFYNFSGVNYMYMMNAARSASQPLEVRASRLTLANYAGTAIAATTTAGSFTVGTITDNGSGAKLQILGKITVSQHDIAADSDSALVWNRATNEYEYAKINGGGSDGNGVYGGSGSLPSATTITGAGNTLTMTGTQSIAAAFNVNNTGNGDAISAVTTGTGNAISTANSGTGTGGSFSSNSGHAVNATSTNGTLFRGIVNPSSTNTEVVTVRTIRQSSATPAAGMGNTWSMDLEDDAGNNITAVQHKSIWASATGGSASANYELWSYNTGTFAKRFSIKSTGQMQLPVGYGDGTHTGTVAYFLGVTSDGNVVPTSSTIGGLTVVNDADHTVLSTESAIRYHSNITGARVITIPDPSAATGREIWIKWNTINGGSSLDITTTSGTALIYMDGTASSTDYNVTASFQSALLKSDGTSWYKIN